MPFSTAMRFSIGGCVVNKFDMEKPFPLALAMHAAERKAFLLAASSSLLPLILPKADAKARGLRVR